MKKSIAVLRWYLDVECPYCKSEFDLADNHDNDSQISMPLFNNKWDDLNDHLIDCPKCDKEFKISKIEY